VEEVARRGIERDEGGRSLCCEVKNWRARKHGVNEASGDGDRQLTKRTEFNVTTVHGEKIR
jgi:hypothetical protein